MNSTNILRHYPFATHSRVRAQYNHATFEEYKEITRNPEIYKNYEKWLLGINYKTNRFIKVGGRTHETLGNQEFRIGCVGGSSIFFDKLDGINCEEYLKEIELQKSVELEYNSNVRDIMKKFQMLKNWDDFVEFDGKHYGIHAVMDQIHRENDCNGKMVFFKENECNGCRNGVAFNGSYSCCCHVIDKCDICGFTT